MADLKYVTYCGLYCKLCAHMARIPRHARALREALAKEGWEDFGEHTEPHFSEFWEVLQRMGGLDESCPGCRGDCGFPGCEIRKCVRERGLDVCSACGDFPCEHIESLGRSYPTLIADGARQREIGLDAWIEEQEERCKTGFAYADIRRP